MTDWPTEIHASQLDAWLDQLPPGVRVLSLDCFDTIIWRKTVAPQDVFFNLQASKRWQAAGIDAIVRGRAESNLHRSRYLLTGSGEVSIEDIYRAILPEDTSDQVIAAFVDEELAAERDHCFAFEPVLKLIERAHAKGLRLIVVSDTYLGRAQLQWLLAEVLGETAQLVDQVYCSSDIGYAKSGGAFQSVLRQEQLSSGALAHLGDNPQADWHAPAKLGIHATQLRQQCEAMETQLAARTNTALQLQPELRYRRGVPGASRALLATRAQCMAHQHDVPWRIGYGSLGPVFAAFSAYLQRRLEAMRATGQRVRVAFLLRDGYLLARAHAAFSGDDSAAQLRISRFTAIGASLQTRDDVLWWITNYVGETSIDLALPQLMLPAKIQRSILRRVREAQDPVRSLTEQVTRPDILRIIFRQSGLLRERLLTHLRSATGLQPGDALLFVDIGYRGTVQGRLRQILRDAMNVRLHGINLIASRTQEPHRDREGIIGPPADERLLLTMTRYVGLLEMMCTIAEPSTIDYAENGDAIRSKTGVKAAQSAVVDTMQDACLQYIQDLVALPDRCRPRLDTEEMASEVVAEIGRLIYFPSQDEIDCLSQFEFDVNLGSDVVLETTDLEAGLYEYRREGFAMLHRDSRDCRVSYPMEMRHMDITLATTLAAAHRFGLGISPASASYRHESVPLLIASRDNRHQKRDVAAHATHDGYFRLHLPLTDSFDSALLLGQRYQWLQLDSVSRIPMSVDAVAATPLEIGRDFFIDGGEVARGGLLHCNAGTMLFIPAGGAADHGRYMVRVVFRPLVTATSATAMHCAADTNGAPAQKQDEPCLQA